MAILRDAVQTLMSVNNIDQTQFVQSDLDVTRKYWDEVFFQNHVSGDIYDAIASLSGAANTTRQQVSPHAELKTILYSSTNRYVTLFEFGHTDSGN